jgi:hypothetical protein
MPQHEKILRNKNLVQLRLSNPEQYSFRELGRIFNIKGSTAHELFYKWVKVYGKEQKNDVGKTTVDKR